MMDVRNKMSCIVFKMFANCQSSRVHKIRNCEAIFHHNIQGIIRLYLHWACFVDCSQIVALVHFAYYCGATKQRETRWIHLCREELKGYNACLVMVTSDRLFKLMQGDFRLFRMF